MRLVRTLCAVIEPLLHGTILLPGVVASQDFDSRHAWVSEDFIFLVENGDGFFGLTIFLTDFLFFIVLGQESSLFHYVLVLLDQVSVTCR
jgi:hypothetical protein